MKAPEPSMTDSDTQLILSELRRLSQQVARLEHATRLQRARTLPAVENEALEKLLHHLAHDAIGGLQFTCAEILSYVRQHRTEVASALATAIGDLSEGLPAARLTGLFERAEGLVIGGYSIQRGPKRRDITRWIVVRC